jgi:hypothetical protein
VRVIELIETWRRDQKWSGQRITHELAELGVTINRRTITRHLTRLGLGQRRFLDPSGDSNREPGQITARWPGRMVHLDVKKVGRIPDGGGWRIHGHRSAQHPCGRPCERRGRQGRLRQPALDRRRLLTAGRRRCLRPPHP